MQVEKLKCILSILLDMLLAVISRADNTGAPFILVKKNPAWIFRHVQGEKG